MRCNACTVENVFGKCIKFTLSSSHSSVVSNAYVKCYNVGLFTQGLLIFNWLFLMVEIEIYLMLFVIQRLPRIG